MTTVTQVTSSISNSILVRTIEDNWLDFGAAEALTISSGIISPTQSNVSVDTESSASTDDLTDIFNGQDGRVLILRSLNAARDVVVKHNGGTSTANIRLDGSADFTLSDPGDKIVLLHDGSTWTEIGRGNNL